MLLRRLVRAQLQLLQELGSTSGDASDGDAEPTISGPREAYALLGPEMEMLEHEQLRVLLLDTRHRVLDAVMLYQGTVNQTPGRISELFREAVRANAPAILLAHNHPSGDPDPSGDDVRLTRDAARAGELLGINVLDHIVIGRGRFISLKEHGAFQCSTHFLPCGSCRSGRPVPARVAATPSTP